ncbi:sensor histidine kinase [Vallitalea sediminicola]
MEKCSIIGDEMKKYKNRKTSLRKKIVTFTTTAIIFSVFFCIIIFYISTYNTLSKYIVNDIEYFLKKTTDELGNKTILVEDMLQKIRDNKVISEYLYDVTEETNIDTQYDSIVDNLKQCVNIYSNQNNNMRKPFVELVYLFDREGNFYKDLYYDKIKQDIFEIDHEYQSIYDEFMGNNQDVQFFRDDKHYIIAFTVYSEYMDNIGTVFFSINISSVEEVMTEMDIYDDSVWCVTDKYDNIVTASSNDFQKYQYDLLDSRIIDEHTYIEEINTTPYIMYSDKLSMGLNCIGGVPKNIIHKLMIESIRIPIIVLAIISIILIIIVSLAIYHLTKPLKTVTDKIRNVGEGNFEEKLPEYNSLEFSEISLVFNKMTQKINYLIKDVYQKKLLIMEKDFKFLQSQMNPHFMFNVLNTIAFKAQIDGNIEIYKMINSFANLSQATINRKNEDKITIEEELSYINYYLYLQKSRYGDKLKYSINYDDEELLNYYIPKLAIQVMVENAVIHGIEKKIHSGKVEVNITSMEKDIIIEVNDDGNGFDNSDGVIIPPITMESSDKKHNGIGINNTHAIIKYFYGEDYGIEIVTNKEGTTVNIKIPFDRGDECV